MKTTDDLMSLVIEYASDYSDSYYAVETGKTRIYKNGIELK
jgi:hypothetical protein